MKLSFLEIESTVSTWPQLGSAILLGGGVTTDTTRRILLGQSIQSGRYYVDLNKISSTLALGAAAESFILAAGKSGVAVNMEEFCPSLFPIARFTFSMDKPNVPNSELAEGLTQRTTNRSKLPSAPLPTNLGQKIEQILAPFSGVHCKLVTDPKVITAIGRIAGEADRLRFLNQATHKELMEEIRWDSQEAESTRDGIEIAHLGLDEIDICGLQTIRNPKIVAEANRLGIMGANLVKGALTAFNNSGGVGLLFVRKPTCSDFFLAGRALMHLWLYLEKCGFGLQPWAASIYFIMRFMQEKGLGFSLSEQHSLSMLRHEFSRYFDLDGSQGLAIMFRITTSPKPIGRSKRKLIDDILITLS